MKKFIIVLAIVVLAALPVVAKGTQVGAEAGIVSGINYRTELGNKFNFTATAGVYNFDSVSAAAGVLWEMDPVKIDKAEFVHQFGFQGEIGIHAGTFYIAPMALGEIGYSFKWINNTMFTAFFRVAYGPSFWFNSDGSGASWNHFDASIGLIHEL